MSMENVKKFYELAEIDKEFAQKLARLDSEMSLEASDLANLKDIVNEKIIPLAKEKGLDFTAEEMVDFANEKYLQLSEEDLLDVSGGVSPKAAALGLSSVLMLSLGSAAAINLMNNNHDDVSHVVSDSAPSTSQSESEAEVEDEEALKKSLDEMMKKSPKGADKNANMEDIEKELDKLFKGGKLGGGSAFRPGKGRTAGKNMLNRTIGKKGTSDFDFDKFLKELDDELAKEAPASQAAKPKATISETSNFDFDKFMEEINSERKSEPGATRAATSNTTPLEEEAKPAPTTTSARIEETTKPAPTSRGTPKKIEKTKEQVEAEKKQSQQQVDKRLEAFKVKFENSFKEKFKTQCDDEDLKAFVQEYHATPGNLDGAMVSGETTVKFYQGYVFSKGSATASTDLLAFAKERNAARPKMQYESVSRRDSWKTIMSHVMGALQEAKYDLSKFDLDAMQKLQNDIDWICDSINKDGYLSATLSANYGKDANSIERKNIEYLKALKDSFYNKDDAKVQAALKALSVDEIKEKNVKKPDASGVDQARRERERKEAEEKARLQVLANKRADDFKEALIEDFKGRAPTKVDDDALRLYAENYLNEHGNERDMDYVGMNVVFYANGSDGITEDSSFDVLDVLREANNALPEKISQGTFESREAAQQIVADLASAFKLTVENAFNVNKPATQLSEGELQQFVSGITAGIKSDPAMQKASIAGSNSVTFFAKGQLKDGTEIEASNTVNVLELAKKLNAKLPRAVVEEAKKAETEKPQEELKEKPVVKSDAGATVTTAKELQKQADAQKSEAETKLNEGFKAKIAANNGIELNEANLNKLISETLNSYKGQENVTVDEKNGTVTFTAKGVTKGLILTGADSRSTTLNVREFFAKLNNEATEERRTSEREKFNHTKYITATEADVTGALKLARETAKKMILEQFNKIIVEKYNAENSAKKATSVEDIPSGKMASIVKALKLDDAVASIVKVNIERTHDFKDPDKEKYEGTYSIKTAAVNEELKISATGYKLTGIYGFRQQELIKHGAEISIREEAEKLIKESVEKYTVSYETVISRTADTEVKKLFEFLENNELIKDGKIVDNVLDAIKDSDKEQFKKDVKHIAGQISGGEGSYSLSGKWRSYNVAQEKLKAIKDLATQLGV